MILSLSILARHVTHLTKWKSIFLSLWIGCLAQTIFWSVGHKQAWICKENVIRQPEESLTTGSKLKQLLGTRMNWHGCLILEGKLILCVTIHHPEETLSVIHKLLWEQNCQGQKSSTSPNLHSRPRGEHHCNFLIIGRMKKET